MVIFTEIFSARVSLLSNIQNVFYNYQIIALFMFNESTCLNINNIDLSHWYKVDKVFYTPEAKLRCVKITSYITKRS